MAGKAATSVSKRVRVADAAEGIGCAPGFLRLKMRTGEWDIGAYSKPKRGGERASYYVFRSKLDKFLGISREEPQE